MLRILKCLSLGVCVLALGSLPAYAAPISGTLNISGAVSVGATTIDWLNLPAGGGQFVVDPSSTGSFASLVGTQGSAKNLNVTVEPVGTPFSLPDFITLPGMSFTLTFIAPGVFSSADCGAAPAPGQTCTPTALGPKSPFNMVNGAAGATVSLSVMGTVKADDGPSQPFQGVYTTQFVGQTFQDLLGAIGGGGTVQASYSANLVTSVTPEVPEPSTMYLTLSGLLLVGGAFARKLMVR